VAVAPADKFRSSRPVVAPSSVGLDAAVAGQVRAGAPAGGP